MQKVSVPATANAEAKAAPMNAQPHATKRPARHYPTDITDLDGSFHSYEHRRISARDVLVHRLMSEVINPSSASTASFLRQPALLRLLRDDGSSPAATSFKFQRPLTPALSKLARDLCILESMTFTSFLEPTLESCIFSDMIDMDWAPTVQERILHVVTRHYMENDDPAFRVWVSRARPPRIPFDGDHGLLPQDFTTRADRKDRQRLLRFNLEYQRQRHLKTFDDDNIRYLHDLHNKVEVQNTPQLYDGGTLVAQFRKYMDQDATGLHGPRRGMNDTHWTINHGFIIKSKLPPWPERFPPTPCLVHALALFRSIALCLHHRRKLEVRGGNELSQCTWDLFSGLGPRQGRYRPETPRRRCKSEPRWGAWGGFTHASFPHPQGFDPHLIYEVYIPTMSVSEMDRRSRRRSLSRRRIEDMFKQRNIPGYPDFCKTARPESPRDDINLRVCENCKDIRHTTLQCRAPCGFCGAPGRFAHYETYHAIREDVSYKEFNLRGAGYHSNLHFAPTCPVAQENRCKCMPFPTFHTADRCSVPCRRDCGNKHPTGSFQHKNAMTCRLRCCMCGIRGHSGKECRLKKCRCGEAHLGQDCGWNPTCKIPGCGRYLCGMHCQDCGSLERPFVGKRCWKCLGFSEPLKHPDGRSARRRERRANKKERDGADNGAREGTTTARQDPFPEASTRTTITGPTNSISSGETKPHHSIFGDPRAPINRSRSQ